MVLGCGRALNSNRQELQGDRLVWADNTRILAIFAVILLHVSAILVIGVRNLDSRQWWIGNIYNALSRWCVPVFVMLSGALLLSEDKVESIAEFYKKRAARVLIPTLFWTLFFVVWSLAEGVMQGHALSARFFMKALSVGKTFVHMWFLYMIIGLYFIAPFIRILVRNTSKREIFFFTIVLFLLAAINEIYYSLHPKNIFLFINQFWNYLPYFIAGHFICKTEWKPRTSILCLVFVLSVVLAALACFFVGEWQGLKKGLYFYRSLSVTVIPMSISIMFLFKKLSAAIVNVEITRRLASLVLGIYFVHPLIITELHRCFGFSTLKSNPAISIPLISMVAFIISAMIAWLIQRIPYLKRVI